MYQQSQSDEWCRKQWGWGPIDPPPPPLCLCVTFWACAFWGKVTGTEKAEQQPSTSSY